MKDTAKVYLCGYGVRGSSQIVPGRSMPDIKERDLEQRRGFLTVQFLDLAWKERVHV